MNTATKLQTSAAEVLPLDLYQSQAALTDRIPKHGTDGVHFALLGLFGEVGSVLSELKKKQRDQDSYFAYRNSVIEEFGDVLWYFANVASRTNLQLGTIGRRAFRALADWDQPVPNGSVTFEELQAGIELSGPLVNEAAETGLIGLAGKVGRLLDDVASGRIDGNRDALSAHLVEIFRALLRAANDAGISLAECARFNLAKTTARWPNIREYGPLFDENEDREEQDETQDGARAVLIEEGVATWVFNHARRLNYFASISSLDYSLLKAIKELVAGYEVERIPLWQWEEAILKGYEVFRFLREYRHGLVIADLNTHSLVFKVA